MEFGLQPSGLQGSQVQNIFLILIQGLNVPDPVGPVGPLVDVERAEACRYHVAVVGEQEARHVVLKF